MPVDIICCPQCSGRGTVALQDAFRQRAEVLDILRHCGPLTATEISPRIVKPILITGINNRLEDLRSMNFVTRERRGKEWLYTAISK